MACYLGIDVGTSGTKTLVMDAACKVLATATAEHGISTPKPGWSEQNPENWWKATCQSVKQAVKRAGVGKDEISAIGFSGQMHGLVITDGAGKPLRDSLIWNDQRTAEQAAQIERAVGGRKKLINLVGNAAMTSFTLTKLLRVRQHEPKIYDQIKHLLLPKDYVRFKMTGLYAGDVSDMSGTLMLDQRKRSWCKKILDTFQIDADILPDVYESHEVVGELTPQAARAMGLKPGIQVTAGGGDQPVGAVGNGVVRDGLTSATMGTSGVVFTHSKDYVADPESRVNTFCASVDGQYCMFGCVMAAGGSFQWYRNVLGEDQIAEAKKKGVDPYELLTAQASSAPAGCEGVFFLPYLTGERTPHADPNAKACWIGIHARTTRNELVRSVLEGVSFAMNDVVCCLKGRGANIREIRLSGGGARSAFWRQLQADIYGIKCVTINAEEGPAYGAALLAATGAGEFSSVAQACKAGIEITRTIKPESSTKKLYAAHYQQFKRLYPALADEFQYIAKL
ncbi:MAG: xylulokinase [Planctomycetota bacterium]